MAIIVVLHYMSIVKCHEFAYYLFSDIIVGLNQEILALENTVASVCAIAKGPAIQCLAAFSFDLLLTTSDTDEDSASTVKKPVIVKLIIMLSPLYSVAGVDYMPLTTANGTMTFEACSRSACWEIPIMGDERVGRARKFNIHLQTVEENNFVIIEDRQRVVTIVDLDGR